jgi:hypothetical protein
MAEVAEERAQPERLKPCSEVCHKDMFCGLSDLHWTRRTTEAGSFDIQVDHALDREGIGGPKAVS